MITITSYSSDQKRLWDDFVKTSKNGTFLFERDYMDYHSDRFVDFSTIARDENASPIALFPANRVGAQLVSHGGLSYGGMVSNHQMTTARALSIFDAWISYCRINGIREIIYKTIPSIYHRGPSQEDRYALFRFGFELFRRDVLSVCDSQYPLATQERRRRGYNKAMKAALEVDESNDFATFWEILENNLAKKHGVRPVHSLSEIENLKSRFPNNIKLFSVRQSGESICAGTVLYCTPSAVHIQYIASDEHARSVGALDLLCMTLRRRAFESYRYFDFGISNEDNGVYLNQGLIEFKEGFGARAICHDFYKLSI